MAKKKNEFRLVHYEPFVFVGDNGSYKIPPLDRLTYEDWKEVAELTTNNATTKQMLKAYKAFFLGVCPELSNEQIGDNQWLQFGSAYFESMGE